MIQLTKTRFADGVWHGELTGTSDGPGLKVWRDAKRVEGLRVSALSGRQDAWAVEFSVPQTAFGDAAAVFLFRLTGQVDPLASLTVLAGKALAGDPRSEVAALRSELELIKRVLRRGLHGPDAQGVNLRTALAKAEAEGPAQTADSAPETAPDADPVPDHDPAPDPAEHPADK